jgi:hypothetical protein
MSNKNNEYPKLPNRDTVTAVQVTTLLNVVGMLSNVLCNQAYESIPGSHKLDGGPRIAAENTFINVCSRLDDILSDTGRWKFDFQDHLEYLLGKLYAQETAFREAQTRVANEASTPHAIHKPVLLRTADDLYIAVLGDPADIDKSVIGLGSSPAEAMQAFDVVFNGGLPENMRLWLQNRIESEKTTKTKKKKSNNNDNDEIGGS